MIIVKKGTEIINTVLGVQEIDTEKVYRALSFCFFAEVDEKHIVYNTLTGEIAELEEHEYGILLKKSVTPSAAVAELIKKWYLVPLEHDDIELCDEVVSFAKAFEKHGGIKEYTVFTTTECNARCFYCYELGCKKLTMDADTADAAARYIITNAPDNKTVHLSWFGGEPLCNTNAMDIISDELNKAGIKFTSRITTNGYLFDDINIAKAVEKWHVTVAQITVDGTEDNYNCIKAYANECGNAFGVVTDNIEKLLENNITVFVRINIGNHNAKDLYQLVEWIANRYSGRKNLFVYPRAILEYENNKGKSTVTAEELLALEEYCSSKGLLLLLRALGEGIRANSCMADSDSSVTILPNGKLGKCEHFTEDGFVGDVYNGAVDIKTAEEFKERINCKEICNGCALYPVCIRLKKCPDVTVSVCDDAYIMIEKAHMARSLEYTYKKLKGSK